MASEDYGQWKILQSLSEGGQAHTYLCKNELDFDSDTIYVLKRLKNKKRIERFLNEINAVRSLAHPNILKIIDFDVNASKPYLVTPYYSRGTLTSIGLENLSVDKALAIFEKICSGVAAAHEKDVIHRDIKPDNIFLSETGEPIVGDFGICHLDNGERFTLTDEAVGAFRFMAPELEDGRYDNIDCRCDVYSLGKLLYWLLTGKSFSREQHREKKYDLIGDDGNRVFPLIYELLDRMIVHDPGERLSDAGEVRKQLLKIIERIGEHGHSIGKGLIYRCTFCATGYYRRVVDDLKARSTTGLHNFGFNAIGNSEWLILVCDYCGHTQIFRPDYAGQSSVAPMVHYCEKGPEKHVKNGNSTRIVVERFFRGSLCKSCQHTDQQNCRIAIFGFWVGKKFNW